MAAREPGSFTPREYQLLAGAMKCLKNDIQVDYPKFAEHCGFKNANSAKASWCGLRKKLDKLTTLPAAPGLTSADAEDGTPAKGSKRKRADTADDEASDGDAKPAPKKRGRKSKVQVKETSPTPEQEDEEAEIQDANESEREDEGEGTADGEVATGEGREDNEEGWPGDIG